jgi:branched-chain amino acid transport system permease protein
VTASSTPGPAQPDAAPGKPARDGSLRDALGWSRPNLPLAVGAIAPAAALPLLRPNDYLLHVLVIAFIYMMVNQAWNLVLGVSGIWSFAQVAIFAIGGYTSGLLALHLGLSPWISMPIGGLFAMLVGIMLGIPAFRVTGIYVALLTFAFNEVVRLLIITDDRNGLTGGAFGLGGLPGFFDAGEGKAMNYWLALVLLVIVSVIVHRIMYSPIGLAFGSLRENSRYAVGRGIDPFRYQLVVFGLSSFLTGIAGAFYAHYLSIIQPQIMGLALSTNLVAMIVIGGLGTFAGPIVGTGVLVFLLEFLRVTEQLRFIFLGIVLLLIIVAMPDGLVGGFSRARIALSRWIAAGDRATAEDPADALSSDVESAGEQGGPPPADPGARP